MGRLLDILKKTYADEKQKSEDIMAYTISAQQQALLMHQVNAYQNAATNQGYQNYVTYNPSAIWTTSTGTTTTTATGIGIVGGGAIGAGGGGSGGLSSNQIYSAYGSPTPPTGTIITVAFTDASGTVWTIPVDASFSPVMAQISAHHQNNPRYNPYTNISMPPQKPVLMVEGDFSMDEMEKAELLIEEMSGLEKHYEATEASNA